MEKIVTMGPKGQIVIPAEIRRAMGLTPGQRVAVARDDGAIVLRPVPKDLIGFLAGSLRGGPSILADLVREHAEEVRRDAEGGV